MDFFKGFYKGHAREAPEHITIFGNVQAIGHLQYAAIFLQTPNTHLVIELTTGVNGIMFTLWITQIKLYF